MTATFHPDAGGLRVACQNCARERWAPTRPAAKTIAPKHDQTKHKENNA